MSDTFGFDELENEMKNVINNLDKVLEEILEDTATECIAEAQSRSPVLSGALRRSWTHDEVKANGNEKSIQLGSAIEYAQYVEEGYKRGNTYVKGRYMLKDSITIAEKEFKDNVEEAIEKVMGGLKL